VEATLRPLDLAHLS